MVDDPLDIEESETQHFLDHDSEKLEKPLPNPLPKLQLTIVLLLQVCEPITSQSIYPYINQLISEFDITGGDDRKVGYYAGLMESLFFATEALTVLQWSRLSDHIGRKPVILIGLLGTTLSMLAFGLSRSFWTLVVSRCLTGLLNGNGGVMKSVMGEITDSTNRAQGYALLPALWCFGAIIGPLIGGTLSHPHERFSKTFSGSFWKDYPYFLPCLVSSCYVLFAFLITFAMLKETLPGPKSRRSSIESCDEMKAPLHDKPLPIRKLLTYPVVLSVANYTALAFLHICALALLPLFLAMPIDVGGLNLSPSAIGYIIGSLGLATVVFQVFFFSRILRRWGERVVFIAVTSLFIPIFLMFPVINFLARGWGQSSFVVWLLLSFLVVLLIPLHMAFSVIFIFINSSAPDPRSLGATNGLSQTTVSIARAIGPALSASLFSFSAEKNILGGYGVHFFFATLSVFGVYLATRLPPKPWDECESKQFDTEDD